MNIISHDFDANGRWKTKGHKISHDYDVNVRGKTKG